MPLLGVTPRVLLLKCWYVHVLWRAYMDLDYGTETRGWPRSGRGDRDVLVPQDEENIIIYICHSTVQIEIAIIWISRRCD